MTRFAPIVFISKKPMKVKAPRTSRALLDVILSVMACIILLVGMKSEGDLVPRVDYVLEVAWNDHVNVDIDTWVMRPDGVKMSYQNKDTGHVSIDRDDLGNNNDPGIVNLEVTSFRKPLDGVYYVSVHNYRTSGPFNPSWIVNIVLRNTGGPRSTVVWAGTIPMPDPREEVPVLAFELKDGKLVRKWKSERYITRWGV